MKVYVVIRNSPNGGEVQLVTTDKRKANALAAEQNQSAFNSRAYHVHYDVQEDELDQ